MDFSGPRRRVTSPAEGTLQITALFDRVLATSDQPVIRDVAGVETAPHEGAADEVAGNIDEPRERHKTKVWQA